MNRDSLTGWTTTRLRAWLVLLFLALAIPTAVLVHQAYSQLKWEAFHHHRVIAEELASRIDGQIRVLIAAEEARSLTEYEFLVVAGDPSANFIQRSPLSVYPLDTSFPGLIGHFQIDSDGTFSTPLLPGPGIQPSAYGITQHELAQRRDLQSRIQRILSENRLVHAGGSDADEAAPSPTDIPRRADQKAGSPSRTAPDRRTATPDVAVPAQEPVAQAAFDRLSEDRPPPLSAKQRAPSTLGRVEDLNLEPGPFAAPDEEATASAVSPSATTLAKRLSRKERSALLERSVQYGDRAQAESTQTASSEIRIRVFDSEIDAFAFSRLDSGHFVLFRKAWRDGSRYIQGVLIEPQAFVRETIESAFRGATLSQTANLAVAYSGNVLSAFSGRSDRGYLSTIEDLRGALLYQTRLSAPLNDMELVFSIARLPVGPGGTIVNWVAAILLVVLCGGFYLMYRLGTGQINLTRQQQDFVSAVSHELKTPLTSIRMYGEMLRAGWVDEEKKRNYYDHIYEESERLSRLIENVLQLARMTRNDLTIDLKPIAISGLIDIARSKVATQVARAGFALKMDCADGLGQTIVQVDPDYFTQIMINLVDNSLKFSAKSQPKRIDINCRQSRDGWVQIVVRDYGPGIPKTQTKKIFQLFYRSGSELTRNAVGTGIGLALVHQLAQAMNAKIDVVNREPGAEFALSLPPAQ